MTSDQRRRDPPGPSRTVRIERLRVRVPTTSRVIGRSLAEAVAAQLAARVDALQGPPDAVIRVRAPVGPALGQAAAPTIAERIVTTSREGGGNKRR